VSICPRCGASNPSENKFCGQCGQLLIADPPSAHNDSDLPAWLRDDATAQPAANGAGVTAQSGEQLPAWLSEIGVDDPPADNPPPWLAELQQPTTTETTSASTTQELPDWLRDLEPELAASTPDNAHAQQPDVPPWLDASAADRETSAAPVDDVPTWLREMEAPSSQPAPSNVAADTEPLPDWINQAAATEPAAAPPAPSDDLPAWLRGDDAPAQPITRDEQAPSAPQADAQLPAWLSAQDDTQDDTIEAGSQNAIPAPPAWLANDEPDHVASAGSQNAIGDTPSWLTADEQSTAQAEVDLPVPDWSNELGDAAASGAHAEADELPAWLRDDATAASTTSTGDLPPVTNWLDEVSADQPQTAAEAHTAASASGDLPAWLRDNDQPVAAPQSAHSDAAPSWLAEASADQPAPSAEATELPAWLRGNDQPATPVAAAPADELPGWLTHESASAPSTANADATPSWLAEAAEAATPTADPGATQALPSWLLDEPTSRDAATTATQDNADALPSWLQPTDEPAPSSDSGIPPWLALPDEPQADQHAAQVYETPDAQAETGDALPAWLAAETTEEPGSPAPSSTAALPTWLDAPAEEPHDDGARVYDVPAAEQPTTTAPAPTGSETVQLPAWLADDAASSASTSSTETSLPSWLDGIADEPAPQPQSSTPALPAWLDQPDEPKPAATSAAPQSELLGGLDLPAWLRGDRETPTAAPMPQEAPAWLERIEPEPEATPTTTAVALAPATPRITRSPERVEAMTLLDQLMTAPPAEPAPAVPVRRRSRLVPILLALIALALIAVVAWVLLSPRLPLSLGAAPLVPAAGAQVAEALDQLPANRPVVLAYEWDAQRIGDLRPLEDALIGQLTARTDVPLVFVSTDPQGALLAGERVAQVRTVADRFHDQYGLGVVNLGFKAGGALAVRRYAPNGAFGDLFARDAYGNDLRGYPITMEWLCGVPTADGCSWNNVGLLVLMADDVDDVRGWFEQLRSAHPDLQTLVLTPAEIGPQVQPYTSLPNVLSLSGLDAAYAYSAARGLDTERVGRQLDATALGTAIWSIALLIGAVPAIVAGRRARRDAEHDAWER
jgi:hypothetical protein